MILGLAELLVVLLAPALMAAALFAQRRVPRPGELLVIYGRRSEGRGFAVQRRAAIVLPLVEAAELVSFTQLPLDVRPRVGMRDGKEVEFEVRAIVRRPEDPEQLGRMLELFAGASPAVLAQFAEDALYGSAVHVLAGRDVREVLDDPRVFAAQMREPAREALEKLGLELESYELIPNPGAPFVG